ncbi:MAG: hypothetical protein HDQ87_01140 [Clostridia bacterium]|nr:hypothetical protein [Clostridia bacterium]
MKRFLTLAAGVLLGAALMTGCAEDATLDGSPAGDADPAAAASEQVDPAVTTLDQTGQVLGLTFRYSSAWEKLVDKEDTVSFRIPSSSGDFYAVISGETMNFSGEADPETAKQNWARNSVNFVGTDTILNYSIGSPSYYYYALDGADEIIGLVFFNGDDFYDLQCSGPGTEESTVMGAWAELIDSLTLT